MLPHSREPIVIRAIAEEAAVAFSLALFVGAVLAWAGFITGVFR